MRPCHPGIRVRVEGREVREDATTAGRLVSECNSTPDERRKEEEPCRS